MEPTALKHLLRDGTQAMINVENTFFKFVIVGISNTLIGMSIIYGAWHFFSLGDFVSNLIGYAVGFLWSFGLHRIWTFQDTSPRRRSFWRYLVVCAIAYAANLLTLFVARSHLGPESFLPHVIGLVTYTILGYLGGHFFAFKKISRLGLVDMTTPV
jgi:putative flippase GtrA